MTYEQWSRTVRSKINTSWNLHQLLPSNLEFFILLSSIVGVYGFAAQSNYAAGCSFQDSLARQRTIAGQRASISLNLGWMRDDGTLNESVALQRRRLVANDLNPVSTADLLAVLEHYCDPSLPPLTPGQSQLIVGGSLPSEVRARGGDLSWAMRTRLFAGFDAVQTAEFTAAASSFASDLAAQLFQKAEGAAERASVVVQAMREKLARALAVDEDEIDIGKSLTDYGVDSLMGVELRNWIKRDFGANLAVFDIMSSSKTIEDIGKTVNSALEY